MYHLQQNLNIATANPTLDGTCTTAVWVGDKNIQTTLA